MNYAVWVTTKCNLCCTYCYEGSTKPQLVLKRDMADQIIQYIIDKERVKSDKEFDVTYHGGEPLLEFDVIKYISLSLKNGLPDKKIYFSFTTNATVLNNEMLDFISKYNFDISISIDGKKQTHDLYRKYENGKGSYDTVIKNSALILKRFPQARARMTYSEKTVSDLAENIYSLISNGFKIIVPVQDFHAQEWSEKHLQILKEQIKKAKTFVDLYGVSIGVCEALDLTCRKVCNGGKNSINIFPNGKIYPCMLAAGIQEFEIGDVNQGIDMKKLNLISEHSQNCIIECDGCSFYDYCENVRCRIINKVLRGNYDSPSEIVCLLNNIFYEINGIEQRNQRNG